MAPVEAHNYRSRILAPNNIHILGRRDAMPQKQNELTQRICGNARASPEPTIDEVARDTELDELFNRTVESSLQQMFLHKFTFDTDSNRAQMLKFTEKMPLSKQHVPQRLELPEEWRLTYPVPDLLYGYKHDEFSHDDKDYNQELLSKVTANADGVILPYFTVEFKGQFPEPGSLWAGENQAAGSSSTCAKVMEALNEHMRENAEGKKAVTATLDSSVFSAVMNGTDARLFVT